MFDDEDEDEAVVAAIIEPNMQFKRQHGGSILGKRPNKNRVNLRTCNNIDED